MIEVINFTDDHCRVVLSGGEKEDYINASFIDVSSFSLLTLLKQVD